MKSTEIDRLIDQLQRSIHGEAWHGASVLEILDGVSANQASAARISGSHSIWEIVLHTITWMRFAREALHGKAMEVDPPDEVDWPRVSSVSESGWQGAVQHLVDEHKLLCDTLSACSDDTLETTVPGRSYSFYHLLHGVVQHNLYHAGQIAILKKIKLAD